MFTFPVGIGQVHAMHELFKADPRIGTLALVIIIALAFYFNSRR